MSSANKSNFVGDQVYLRGIEEEDLDVRHEWFCDTEILATLMMDFPISRATTKTWFQRIVPKQHQTRVDLSICNNGTGEVIGMTGLLNISRRHSHAQLYITIGNKEFWGRHIPDQVICMLLQYAFREQDLNKVYLWTIPANERARHVYERNGFVQEAVLKQHYFCRGGLQDLFQHCILRSEWSDRRR